ncbi:MAG: HD domain-containing protein [Gemmatimonadaceae bacterium]|nr:HD domain-containing protein [Gemmatimonadaceae bacterium]
MSRTRLITFGALGAWIALNLRRRHDRQLGERVAAAALEALLNAIDANDSQTGAHVRRVAAYALVLADAAGLDEHERSTVERVALYHDIGKLNAALFDIVHDTDKLSEHERALIITHPQLGADVIRPLSAFYPELYEGVLTHHERWDGSGYPRGLRGADIPMQARIVAFADTFDVITHGRRYERERSVNAAREVIANGRGTQFDPQLTDLFLSEPVFGRIVETFHAATSPQIVRPDRRDASAAIGGPDITFRWRNGATAQPPRDRSH